MDEWIETYIYPHTNLLIHNIFGYLCTIDKINCVSMSATIGHACGQVVFIVHLQSKINGWNIGLNVVTCEQTLVLWSEQR